MSILTPITRPIKRQIHRVQAALSPAQMGRQLSRPEGGWMNDMYGGKYKTNPDDRTYEDYDEMYDTDPQIKGSTKLIKQLLQSRKLIVTPYDDTSEAKEQSDFIKKCLDDMDYPLRQVLNDLYTAIQYGYAVSEKVFKYDEETGRIVLKKIKPIDIATLEDCFELDKEGSVINVVQRETDEGEITIPIEKCVKYTHDEKFGNPYGVSLYKSIYDNWYQKRKIMKWWMVFLQKHEGPTLVGKAANPAYKDLLREQLEEVREGRTNVTVGMDDEVSVLESSHRGEGFQDAIRYHDTMILHGMNIGPLLIGQDQDTGSYGQSKSQENITFIYLDGVHEDIAAEFEKLSKELCGINFANPLPPMISFEPFEDKDLLGLLNTLKPFFDSFAINPSEPWVKELIGKAVEKYSDVTVPIDNEMITENVPVDITPTPEEINQPLEVEQTQLVDEVANLLPGETQ